MEHARCQPGDPAHPFRAIYRAAAGWHSRQRPRPHPNAAPELTFKVEVKRGRPGRSLLELSGDTDLLVIGASDTRSGPAHAPPRLDKTRAATYQLHLGRSASAISDDRGWLALAGGRPSYSRHRLRQADGRRGDSRARPSERDGDPWRSTP
jgi:hypothetical protein